MQIRLPPTTAAPPLLLLQSRIHLAGRHSSPLSRGGLLLGAVGVLTDGDAAVRAAEVDVAVGDCRHADLVERAREEGGKGAGKSNGPVTSGTTNCNAHLRQGHWRRTLSSSFISGFQDSVCGTYRPKHLARSSCFYLLAFPERKGGNSPSLYLFSCISSAPCSN